MKRRRVTLKTGRGYSLSVEIDMPTRKQRQRAVAILCHGLGVTKEYALISALNQGLLSSGYATIRFDFAGHGQSGGAVKTRLVRNFISDLERVYKMTMEEPGFKGLPVVIIGHSIGALAALLHEGLHRRHAGAVVLIGCNSVASRKYEHLDARGKIRMFKRYMLIGRTRVPLEFWSDRRHFEPKRFMPRITVPTLIICGTSDVTNPPAESKQLYQWSRATKKLLFIHGADHYIHDKTQQRTLVKGLTTWMGQNIS